MLLTSYDVTMICSRLSLALVLAGIVGLERQRKARGAGLRTHILVCLASTTAMTAMDILTRQKGLDGFNELSRVAQGVMTGIGFIGAGTILTVGFEHRGLTTAAMLWFVAAMGIAVGTGLILLPVCATVFALFVTLALEYFERAFPVAERMILSIRMAKGLADLKEMEKMACDKGFWVAASHIVVNEGDPDEIELDLTAPAGPSLEEMTVFFREKFPHASRISLLRD